MTIVVDASVLVAALVDDGADGVWSRDVLAEGRLAAPELVLAEASNILRRLEIAGEITRFAANRAQTDPLRFDIELFPFAPFGDRVWELRANLTSYDAWYAAVAETLGCPLATLDYRLSRASGPTCAITVPPPILK